MARSSTSCGSSPSSMLASRFLDADCILQIRIARIEHSENDCLGVNEREGLFFACLRSDFIQIYVKCEQAWKTELIELVQIALDVGVPSVDPFHVKGDIPFSGRKLDLMIGR